MHFALTPVALGLLLYAPGHFLLPPSVSDGPRTGSRLLREVLLSTCCSSWLGFVLAEFGVYSLSALLTLLGMLALIGRVSMRARGRWGYGAIDLLGLGIVTLGCLWTAPPLDTRLLASDSAGYLASGVHLSRHGSLIIHDPTLPSLPPDLKRVLFPSAAPDRGSPPYVRLQGSLILRSLDTDQVLPAFHHLIAVWIAAFYGVGGTDAAAWVITLFAGLSLWAIVEFAAFIGGRTVALSCLASLLLLSPQYWYSRFLMPEVPGQFFLWSGLGCLAFWYRSDRRSDLVLAGVAFGISGLVRVENIGFLLIAFAGVCSLWSAQERRRLAPLFVVMLPIYIHAAVHLSVFRTHYFGNLQAFAQDKLSTLSEPLLVLLGGSALAVLLLWRRVHRAAAAWPATSYVVLLVVSIAACAYGDYRHGWASIGLLAYYCGVPLLVGGGLGLLISTSQAHERGPAWQLLLVLVSIVLMQVIIEPHATPVPIWTIRRAVTVVLPALALGLALLCGSIAERWHWSIAAVFFILSSAGELRSLRPLREGGYYAGATRDVEAVAALIQPGARLLFDSQLIGSGLDVTLWSQHDWPAYVFAAADRVRIRELAARLDGAPLYWLSTGKTPPPHGAGLVATPIALYEFVLTTQGLDRRYEPGTKTNWEYTVGLYSLQLMGPGLTEAAQR